MARDLSGPDLVRYVALEGRGTGFKNQLTFAGDDIRIAPGGIVVVDAGRMAWSDHDQENLTGSVRVGWDSSTTLSRLPECIHSMIPSTADTIMVRRVWIVLTRLAEAAATIARERAVLDDTEARLRSPLFERLRFLLFSLPYRVDQCRRWDHMPFGSRDSLAFLARRARVSWFETLSSYGDHILLAQMPAEWHEREARRLVFRSVAGHRGDLLVLSKKEHNDHDFWAAEDDGQPAARSFVQILTREVFLRRMMLRDALSVAWRAWGGGWLGWMARSAMLGCAALLLGAAALVVLLRFGLVPFIGPVALAAGAYVIAAAGIVVVGPAVGDVLCLRLPAATAVGVAALVTLSPGWWASERWWLPAVSLVVAAGGYLAVEARANGVGVASALRRAKAVLLLGGLHAIAVSTIAFFVAAEVFYQDEPWMTEYWDSSPLAAQAILLGAAVGLALGVFLQVLWEDRPVTYPLAHLEWRSSR